jgi:hypothetical protein
MDTRLERRVRQAHRAQQRRGGAGGRKRCRKGKSCGASCIGQGKVCLVDITSEISSEIGKVAREVTSRLPKGGQRKAKVRELLSQDRVKSLDKEAVNRSIKSLTDYIKSSPANDNRANRDSLLMLRALRAGFSPTETPPRVQPGPSRGATRYDRTPGSSKPIEKADAAKVIDRLRKEIKDLDDRIDKIPDGGGTNRQTKINLLNEKFQLASQIRSVEAGRVPDITLQSIYNMQGYNAKPELVQTRSELERSGKILKNSDGSPVILYRGVADSDYSDQFKGLGPQGDYHFPGQGIYGNGSYAASASRPGTSPRESYARDTAKAYARGYNEPDQVNRRVTAFGLRADANIIEFRDTREYREWSQNVLGDARSKTGYKFTDVGLAAAALGIHAYRFPVESGVDYWVVLNRGAVVAAINPEMP